MAGDRRGPPRPWPSAEISQAVSPPRAPFTSAVRGAASKVPAVAVTGRPSSPQADDPPASRAQRPAGSHRAAVTAGVAKCALAVRRGPEDVHAVAQRRTAPGPAGPPSAGTRDSSRRRPRASVPPVGSCRRRTHNPPGGHRPVVAVLVAVQQSPQDTRRVHTPRPEAARTPPDGRQPSF
jgi:hypothetical protein